MLKSHNEHVIFFKKIENENTYSGGYKGGYTVVHRT